MVAKTDSRDGAAHDSPGWLPGVAIALFAFCVRALPVRNVFIDGQTYFTDSDSYYHLRRIAYNLASFPNTLDHDPYLNFPDGAKAIWPQTLDWLLAVMVWPFYTAGSEPSYERALAWVPPLVGALTVYVVFRLVARHFGRREAGVAAIVLAVLPAHFWYSQIGFVDHHVFVALLAALLLASTMDLIRWCGQTSLSNGTLLGRVLPLAALQAASLAIWPGALLYVALSQAALVGVAIFADERDSRRRALAALGLASFIALVGIAPLSLGSEWLQWGPFSAVVLSNFQPWWFATAGLAAVISLQWVDRSPNAGVVMRAGMLAAIALGVAAVSGLVFPDLAASFRESAQWLGKTDSFQALVGESVPLFILHGKFTTAIANSRLSLFVYLFPFSIAFLAFQWRGELERSSLYAFVLWAVVLFGFTLLQKRFFNTFSIGLAMTFGVAVVRSHDVLRARPQLPPLAATGLVVLLSSFLLAPCLKVYSAELRNIAQSSTELSEPRNLRIESNILRREMTNWLRENTPVTRGFGANDGAPEYGVLARWGEGHFITYVARRPAVMGNFGDDLGQEHFLLARSFFGATPARAEVILEELGVRYVVIRSISESRPMARALFESDGSRLGRFRLVHEVRPHTGQELASYKIFEFVSGAELVGSAPPRVLVKAQLDFTTNLGREAHFEMVAQADAEGRYRFRLPYATRDVAGLLHTPHSYRVSVDDVVHDVAVDESAVQRGASLPGPAF